MLCKISKERNSRAPRSIPVLTLSYSFPSYAGHYGVTPEIVMPGRNSGSQQIGILILEFIRPAFGELRFHLMIMLRMLGLARFFHSRFKKSKQTKKSPKPNKTDNQTQA